MIKRFFQALSTSEPTVERSGQVARAGFAHAHQNSRGHYVLMLEGDATIYRLVAEDFDDAEALALARPGDKVSFSFEPADDGLNAGGGLVLSFHNASLPKSTHSSHEALRD
jgi:hypothetical protein